MKITTKLVLNMNTGEVMEHEFYDYSGPVALAKDHGQDAAAAQQKRDNALQDAEVARQHAVQDQIKGAVSPYITDGGQGFSPEMMAYLQSQFLNQNSSTYNQAGGNVRSALASRGVGTGALPVGGDYVRGIAELEGSKAGSQSTGLLGLGVQNAQQALTNKFNAFNALNGVASQGGGNIGVFGQGASSALNNYVQAKSIPGFGEKFGGALATSLGSGIGTFLSPVKPPA